MATAIKHVVTGRADASASTSEDSVLITVEGQPLAYLVADEAERLAKVLMQAAQQLRIGRRTADDYTRALTIRGAA